MFGGLVLVSELLLGVCGRGRRRAASKKTSLNNIQLSLKDTWQVFKVNSRAIDFLGFRFFRNKTILRQRNALRIKRRFRKISKKQRVNYKDACAVISYWGWLTRSDSYRFYNEKLKPLVDIKIARKVVSRHDNSRNHIKTHGVCTNT